MVRHSWDERPPDFLPGVRQTTFARWGAPVMTALLVTALTLAGVHWVTSAPSFRTAGQSAQAFADAADASFTDSAAGSDVALSADRRRADLPSQPVAGLTSQTAAGPVQLVLPAGLGDAVPTTGGHVVYPNRGAGFDLLAENTATGTRTVSRIAAPDGVRVVTAFLRTPADTVMLAHANGYLTINRAAPTAETVAMFSPAETRDAKGALVPSSYVVRRVAPQLYQLSEVIDPRPDTSWPVYVDPPLHLAGPGGAPLPQFSFSDVTGAMATAASATVLGAKTVGTFVKNNPLESAMLVGGVALAVTGAGGPAGAAMIAATAVNISSAAVDIAAAAMPDNQALGIASTALGVASMATPQGAAKKVVEEGVEIAVEKLATHVDDIVDVTKAAPTPPTQLAEDVAAVGAKPPAAVTAAGLHP